MPPLRPRAMLATHIVENQPPHRGDCDLWVDDPLLRAYVARFCGGAHERRLAAYGAALGTAEVREEGRDANWHPPELVAFDRSGRRIDEVRFHPAYHAALGRGVAAGYAALPWSGTEGGHVAHAAMVYLQSQVEPGVCCPMTMTYAAVPTLAAESELAAEWTPRLLSESYDGSSRPVTEKTGATLGMAMTEKQGGSDVRANTAQAARDGDDWRLNGHKWFCSAPMSDGFLTLAQAPGGLTCFLVPRWTPDGARNAIEIQRLKDKLGNRANASAEIEYAGSWARAVGAEGDGVRTILTMVHHTRLDTAMAPAGLMRAGLVEALWWCAHREAFGRRLLEAPLMQAVLSDLALESEAALALGLRVASAFDNGEQSFARLAVALAKFLANRRCPTMIAEAMECLGGSGYVEESPMPMLYREAPLNSIWEGSGNVICLDILRSLGRDPEAAQAIAVELDAARGADPRFDAALASFRDRWPAAPPEAEARWFAERLATLLAASVLISTEAGPAAEAYLVTRVAGAGGRVAGAWPEGLDRQALVDRATVST